MDLQPGGNLLRNGPNRYRIQRQALLHLVHPDTFEYIVNVNHKEKIAQAFNHFVNYPTNDSDRKLTQMRSRRRTIPTQPTSWSSTRSIAATSPR